MNKSLFELQVIYFKLCNLPGIFQKIMNSIFQELLYKEVLVNYMDNFVIPAKTIEELKERTIWFFKITEKHNLCFKQSKCDFNNGENTNIRSYCQEGTSQNGTGENQGSKRIEDTDKNQRYRKLPRIYELPQTIHSEFQPHSKTIQ